MTREDAVKWLTNLKSDIGKIQFRALWDYAQAIDEIIKLLSAEAEWIPCSERPPEKDGRYKVTRHDGVTNTEFIDILWYEENLWWNRHSTGDYAVTAWMPLPKPYRKGGEL